MDPFSRDAWKQQWDAFVSAPFIIFPPLAVVAFIVWWFRGRIDEAVAAGLREQIKAFETRLQLADDKAARANEIKEDVVGQFNTLKLEVAAKVANGDLTGRVVRLEAAIEKLSAANNAVRSAIGVAAGASAVTGISGPLSNTPLPSSAAQAEIISKWWK